MNAPPTIKNINAVAMFFQPNKIVFYSLVAVFTATVFLIGVAPVVLATTFIDCPTTYGTLVCGPGERFCGNCVVSPPGGDRTPPWDLTCSTCTWSCPSPNVVCGSVCGPASGTNPTCTAKKVTTDPCGNCTTTCLNPATDTYCSTSGTCVTRLTCGPGENWNGCLCTPNPYILASPVAAQNAYFNIGGNGIIGGDIYMAPGKAIRVDGNGVTNLNFGNWGSGATGFNLNVSGTSTASKLCLGGNCIANWDDPGVGSAGTNYWMFNKSNMLYPNVGTNAYTVGIGTTNPNAQLNVVSQSTLANRGIMSDQYSTNAAAALNVSRKSRGTLASPTAVVNGDYVGAFGMRAYDGASFIDSAGLGARVNGTVSAGSVPQDLYFYTASANQNDPYAAGTVRMVINSAGNVGVGTVTIDPGVQMQINPPTATEGIKIKLPAVNPWSPINIHNSVGTSIFKVNQSGTIEVGKLSWQNLLNIPVACPAGQYVSAIGTTDLDCSVPATASGPPSGLAGGDLTGTYPNPTIKNDAITSAKIADGTIANNDLAIGSVTSGTIGDGAVSVDDINTGAVTGSKIALLTITNGNMADNSINGSNIIDGAITASKINRMAALPGQVLTYNGSSWVPANPGSGADNWGTQVVQRDSTLSGTGVTGSLLGLNLASANTWTGIQTFNGATAIQNTSGNFYLDSNDTVQVRLDKDNNGTNYFQINNGANSTIFQVDETGQLTQGTVPWARITGAPINSLTSAGLVSAGTGNNSKVWGTDASGNPGWQTPAGGEVIGNEVLDAADTTLTRSGAGTAASPWELALNVGNANTWTGIQTFSGGTNFPGGGIWNVSGNVGIKKAPTSGVALDVNGQAMFGSATEVVASGQNLVYGNMDTTSAGNLLLLQNESVDKFKVDKDGIIQAGTVPWARLSGSPSPCAANQYLQWNGSAFICAAGGGPPSGSAGGDLTGTYPNPTIAAGAVTSGKIADSTITAADIAYNTITGERILDGTITGTDIANNTIFGRNIIDGDITGDKISQMGATIGQVYTWNGANWAPATPTGGEVIGNEVLGTADTTLTRSGAGTIVSPFMLALNMANTNTWTVTQTFDHGFKIGASNVGNIAGIISYSGNDFWGYDGTAWKSLTATGGPPSGSAGGDLTGTYPNPTIATGAVTSGKIANATITGANIASITIATGNIANSAITSGKIQDGAIMTNDIANSTITGANIANSTITAAKIADDTITAANIAYKTITADELASMGATNGQVLTYITASGGWAPADVAAGVGDNLGNHTATQTLNMNTNSIINVVDFTATGNSVVVGNSIVGSKVGIGTATPATKAEIRDDTAGTAQVRITDTTQNPEMQLQYGSNTTNDHWGIYSKQDSNNDLRIWSYDGTSGVDRLIITRAGKVGIGVTPDTSAQLTVPSLKVTGGTLGAGKVLTSDAAGLASWQTSPGGPPSGAASGDLTGTYPNPTIANGVVTGTKIAATTIATGNIIDGAVTSAKIANGTIVDADIAVGALTGGSILNGTITVDDIANSTITGAKIANTTIATSNIVDGAITSLQIANNTIVAEDINQMGATNGQVLTWNGSSWGAANPGSGADNWGTQTVQHDATLTGNGTAAPNLLGLNLSTANTWLADITVSKITPVISLIDTNDTDDLNPEIKIGDSIDHWGIYKERATNELRFWYGAVTGANKVSFDTNGVMVIGTIPIARLDDGATSCAANQYLQWNGSTFICAAGGGPPSGSAGGDLTGTYPNPTIANGVVTGTKIAATTIATGNIIDGAVTSAKILDGTIANADIAINAVTSGTILNGTITVDDIANSTITGANIANSTITSADIADNTILGSNIMPGAITSLQIANNTIVAADINQMGATNGQVLTWNGSSWGAATPAGAGLAGGGTTNYVAKFTNGTTLGNSSISDNGTKVAINVPSPSGNSVDHELEISGRTFSNRFDLPETTDVNGNGAIMKGEYFFIHNYAPVGVASDGENTFVGLGAGNNTMTLNAGDPTYSGARNTGVGKGALRSLTTGGYNTALGAAAMYNITSGKENSAFGQSALFNITSGQFNTVVGASSMPNLTTGSKNTAVGHNALFYITTGSENVAIGNLALFSLTNGDGHIAIGAGALYSDTANTYAADVAIGQSALGNIANSETNVAIGTRAMRGPVAGTSAQTQSNVAIGAESLLNIAGGGWNVALGQFALKEITTGRLNVGIGYNSGTGVTTGENNVFIGYGATALATTQNSIAIGYNAQVDCDNCMVLGNGSIKVGIGDSTPDYTLDVVGTINATAYSTGGADYAEWFAKEGTISPGDLVGINLKTGKARKYVSGDKFIGICSKNPAMMANMDDEKTPKQMESDNVLVGLVGQLDFNRSQANINGRLVTTKDGQEVGVLLDSGQVFIGR